MEQEGTNSTEPMNSDSSAAPERIVPLELSHNVTSFQKISDTGAKTETIEQRRDPMPEKREQQRPQGLGSITQILEQQRAALGIDSMSKFIEQQRSLGLGSITKMLEQQHTALNIGSMSKFIEQQRTLGLGSVTKMLEQQRTALGIDSMSKFIEQQRTIGLGSMTKMLEQQRTVLGIDSTSKFIEQQRTLGLGSMTKTLEQQLTALGIGSMSKLIEQQRTLGLGSMTKMLEQQRTALGIGSMSKFIEQQRTLGLGSITKMLEQQRTALGIGSMSKLLEQQRATLGSLSIARAMDILPSHASTALNLASLTNLLDELKERTVEATSSNLVPISEPHGLASEGVTDGLKEENHNSTSKSSKLALVPTRILILLIHALMLSAYVLENWETIRMSIVDISARMPQTENFSEIRKFIRTELAGKPGDVRLVRGDNVNLREDPGMKARIIMSLPKNSPVIVLGKEDRTWLYVSYEHQGYWIEGYISTKQLKKIRRDLSSR